MSNKHLIQKNTNNLFRFVLFFAIKYSKNNNNKIIINQRI